MRRASCGRRSRGIPSVIAALALALVVAGCGGASAPRGAPSPASRASSQAGTANTAPAAALRRFYRQRLGWKTCDRSFQCASLAVPLDYTRPKWRVLHLAVIRRVTTGRYEQSLVVNPGGPGASGVQFVEQDARAFSGVTGHDDLVSFDPRGVGGSDPIRCLSNTGLDALVDQVPVPTTAAARASTIASARHLADACYRRNGQYLEHVGTIDEARDMDVLRAALGEAKLTYYGASYGTYLGAKYAQLFPHRIRAMVLDGALDPAESASRTNLVQAMGFETDLHDFLTACVDTHGCSLGATVSAATSGLHALMARIAANPEAVGSRRLGPGEFFEGLAAGMYSPASWPALRTALKQVAAGEGESMLRFSDALTERRPDGSYSNLIEANTAINCIDRPSPRSVATYERKAAAFARRAPDFGAAVEYGSLPCAFWRVPPVETPHPVHARGAPPILVIGTTRDPATPYVWAQALARQLASGVLLTYDSDGHTAYTQGSSCIDRLVDAYLLALDVPRAGTRCD